MYHAGCPDNNFMKTVQEVYQESIERIQSVDAIAEVSSKILELTDALYKKELQNWSADMISRAITSLAILRVNLGQTMANSVAMYDISYLHRKMRYASEWQPTKQALMEEIGKATVQDIESQVLQTIAEDQESELKNKHYAEQLRILYDSTETLITAMQSRLSVLKQERSESRYQT